jgi:hypothetical protein
LATPFACESKEESQVNILPTGFTKGKAKRSYKYREKSAAGNCCKNAASAVPKLRSLKEKEPSPEIRDAASAALKAIEGTELPPTVKEKPGSE